MRSARGRRLPERNITLILTCEHASHRAPLRFSRRFASHFPQEIRSSHLACDLYAWEAARHLQSRTGADLLYGRWSRLCIDLNRSLHNPSVWSDFSHSLSPKEKSWWVDYYLSYRSSVERRIQAACKYGKVVHLSVHSFAPVLNGVVRRCDAGILYDPNREEELSLALKLKDLVNAAGYRMRRNYPYRGIADGFTTYLRRRFPRNYLGLELELNQSLKREALKIVDLIADRWPSLQDTL